MAAFVLINRESLFVSLRSEHSSTPSSAELLCVAPADIEKWWPHVDGLLRKAIERTGLSDFEDITSALFTGAHLLWIARIGDGIAAVATTQLVKSSTGNACIIVACSGENSGEWLHLISGLENYAKDEGCSVMRIYGRKGWMRALDGYKANYVVLEKAL